MWSSLSAAIRCRGEIVLNVASSGIASLLLPGGRTAHSRFKIPINVTKDSFCWIKQGSSLAELIVRTRLIIWDEAPMMHKHCFEALDRTLPDLMHCSNQRNSDLLFGGIAVVFCGDFRQILPVIPKGSRQDVVNDIGDGVAGDCTDGFGKVVIPRDLLLECTTGPLQCIVSLTYPTFGQNVEDSSYLENRAILAPTLEVVEMVNQYMMSHNCSQEHTYLSADSVVGSDSRPGLFEEVHKPELLNGVRCSGLPNHELHLKIGILVMLLRNIDHDSGLCNGTRLIITRLGSHVLEAKVLAGRCAWDLVLLPRLSLSSSDLRLPFKFQR
ncbi:ATP-dependent DNA helicase pfh1-like [Salvia hispanica]|uniref:ATP-dependent DNA helicase pfh1-like n=1 Tax=Salvia hispanica TaxID=49212 RepID=UPI0020091615|nr:ATP-dependent DNA helicase pfh1-like [Salvia hispanica]